MNLMSRILGGRPMIKLEREFWDGIEHKQVYSYMDTRGRVWLATSPWALFRVPCPKRAKLDPDSQAVQP